jgi:hypothetical protein
MSIIVAGQEVLHCEEAKLLGDSWRRAVGAGWRPSARIEQLVTPLATRSSLENGILL